jgi:hypothetical protein
VSVWQTAAPVLDALGDIGDIGEQEHATAAASTHGRVRVAHRL